MKETINDVFFYDEEGQSRVDQIDAEIHIHAALLSMLHENNILNDKVFNAAMESVTMKGVVRNE